MTRSFRGTRWYSPVCGPRQGPVTTPPPFRAERSNRSVNGVLRSLRACIDLFARNGETEGIRRIDGFTPRLSVSRRERERGIRSLLASPITESSPKTRIPREIIDHVRRIWNLVWRFPLRFADLYEFYGFDKNREDRAPSVKPRSSVAPRLVIA